MVPSRTVEILRQTLEQLEREGEFSKNEPVILALRRLVSLTIQELELIRDRREMEERRRLERQNAE